MPQLRKDPVVERWVITSTDRAKRPSDFQRRPNGSRRGPCPFCAGNEGMSAPEILSLRSKGRGSKWSLRVVPNLFPALTMDGGAELPGAGIYEVVQGVGTHEVVIETPDHEVNMGVLSERQFELVLRTYRDRIVELKKDRRIRHVLVFKNQGLEAGATLEHTHSQLIALPVVPRAVAEELSAAEQYHRLKGQCVYCDIVRHEVRERTRIVSEGERFVVICAFAARFAYESWILPKRHGPAYEEATEEELADLARCLRETLSRLNRVLYDPPFNFFVHSSPVEQSGNAHYHWHIEITPKLTQVAGFELGSGIYINQVAPEEAAMSLREAGA